MLTIPPPQTNYFRQILNISEHTITDWGASIREVYIHDAEMCLVGDGQLGGPGKVVEIDEAKFGGRKYNRGRRVKGK